MDFISKEARDAVRRDVAEFIVDDIYAMYSAVQKSVMQAMLLFRILQAMYAVQSGVPKPVFMTTRDILEQIVGQFHKEYDQFLLLAGLEILAYRNLVRRLHDGRWIITALGGRVTNALWNRAKKIPEYRKFIRISESANVLPKQTKRTIRRTSHLRIVH